MIATTKLNPTAAPHTEIVSEITGMGVCDSVVVVKTYRVSITKSNSIIVSRHIRATIRCLCCMDMLIIANTKVIIRVFLISSIVEAYRLSSFESKSNV